MYTKIFFVDIVPDETFRSEHLRVQVLRADVPLQDQTHRTHERRTRAQTRKIL
jgi:hypothetical protein